MAVVTISGLLLPLMPVANGITIAGMMMPAITISTIISMRVKPLLRAESSEFEVRSSECPILNLQSLNFELNSNFLISLDPFNPRPLGPFNHEIFTFPVYCNTVIVLVTPPAETVTAQTPGEDVVGSPRELKVNCIVEPMVAPDS